MHRKTVNSSQISSIGYDAANKTLEVEFKPRGDYPASVYQYSDVPVKAHSELMKSKSVGSHFHANIKGKFAFKKIS